MSGKLLPCPFCGGEARTFEYDGANQATCGGKHIDCAGTDVVAPVAMWNRRTPAPEGEAVCSGCEGRPVFPNVPCAVCGASPVVPAPEGAVAWRWRNKPDGVWNYQEARQRITGVEQQPLYASPVVPVGVSEEQRQRVAEIVEAAIERHAPANSIRHTLDDADAIIAALRPTDTGANHD